mmetsp:Transcript_42295/g.102202  ORF Transcript_42295/g.102202 Transcript_42295/m.102202 type:complete len:208 (+) Transcript_42295:1578-2201(+)
MVDYLLMNSTPRAIPLIKLVVQKVIIEQMNRDGMERSTVELSSLIESLDWNGNLEVRRQCLDNVFALLSLHIKTEAISILELALWKKSVHSFETKQFFVPRTSTKRQKVDRDTCRMTSGASVVIPNVIGFLWDKSATVPVDLSMLPSHVRVPVDLSMLPSHVSWMKQGVSEESRMASLLHHALLQGQVLSDESWIEMIAESQVENQL